MYTVPDQSGRCVIITGATSGLGREATRRISGAGGHVIMAVRSTAMSDAVRQEILADDPKANLDVRQIDTADLGSVERFVDALIADGTPVDALINNAGVMAVPRLITTVDGFELQMGTNYFGALALTMRLLPRLLESPAPRVTMTSSIAAYRGRFHLDDLRGTTRKYSPMGRYGASKVADLMMALHLARVADRRGWNLISNAAHPGATRTNLDKAGPALDGRHVGRSAFWPLERVMPWQEVETGTEPTLFAACDPAARGGTFYGPIGRLRLTGPNGVADIHEHAQDHAVATQLWSATEELTGTRLPD